MDKYNSDITGNRLGNHEGLAQRLPQESPQRLSQKSTQKLPQRKSIRLKGYDYSQAGFYFITIVTQNRINLFGKIENGEMILNDAGKMVENQWLKLPERFNNKNHTNIS
jgi:hypothetical protein